MKIFFGVITGLLLAITGYSQSGAVIESFTASLAGNKVRLDFTLAAGSTCNGIEIFRASDNQNFILIGDIQGICGSTDRSEHYLFVDNSPLKNQFNYYRLLPGSSSYSQVIKIRYIDFEDSDYLQFPNLFHDGSKIYFLNPGNKTFQLQVFTSGGQLLFERTAENEFEIKENELKPGIYLYTIHETTGSGAYLGRFIVY